jgi:hypothetical protein
MLSSFRIQESEYRTYAMPQMWSFAVVLFTGKIDKYHAAAGRDAPTA